ncbi:MAG TPA: hypothetical protein VJV78_37710 [Polyangiales bacterium]|nr:hypothetical protein [Polyangiales bacterium]
MTIVPEGGPLRRAEEQTIGRPRVDSSTAGSADDDAGAAGGLAPGPVQFEVRELRPDLAACPEHRECVATFTVARSETATGTVSLTVESSAHRPLEEGCMGSTAPEFTPGVKIEVIFDE